MLPSSHALLLLLPHLMFLLSSSLPHPQVVYHGYQGAPHQPLPHGASPLPVPRHRHHLPPPHPMMSKKRSSIRAFSKRFGTYKPLNCLQHIAMMSSSSCLPTSFAQDAEEALFFPMNAQLPCANFRRTNAFSSLSPPPLPLFPLLLLLLPYQQPHHHLSLLSLQAS